MSSEDAMKSFIKEVCELDPKFKPMEGGSSPQKGSPQKTPKSQSSAYLIESKKDGILFKQRDFVKGWRPRYFILQQSFLEYYIDKEDAAPRKSMDVRGCEVSKAKVTKVGDKEYHPFVISHSKSSKTYNLAAPSEAEAEDWIRAILEASRSPADEPSESMMSPAQKAARRDSPGGSSGTDAAAAAAAAAYAAASALNSGVNASLNANPSLPAGTLSSTGKSAVTTAAMGSTSGANDSDGPFSILYKEASLKDIPGTITVLTEYYGSIIFSTNSVLAQYKYTTA